MNRFQLFLDTQNEDLFRKATCELGTIFYQYVDEENVHIVYFSGSRIARFTGKPSQKLCEFLMAFGFQVSTIEVDEAAGTVRIIQEATK